MQAQATNAGNAGASDAPQSFLQNPKIQIGVIVVGALALIVVIWMVFFPPGAGGSAPAAPPAGYPAGTVTDSAAGAYPAGSAPAGYPAGAAPAAGGYPGGAPALPTTPGAAPAAPGAIPAQPGAEANTAPQAPGVPTRKNPFVPNSDLKRVIGSIPPPPTRPEAVVVAPELDVYKELYTPENEPLVSGDESTDGPPIPPMRVAGVIFGNRAGPTATLQMGEQFIQVTPGKMIPEGNPVYRVERIEQDKVVLTRRWEMAGREGVQRIEVSLAGSASRPAGGGFMPGGMMGGGYPGAGMMGYPGGAPAPQ